MTSSADLPDAVPDSPESKDSATVNDPLPGHITHTDSRELPHEKLWSPRFICLLVVQFLTVLNDHTFRWLVVPIAKPVLGHAAALSMGLAAFTVPFIILATPAGFLADRFSKARVIQACKAAEVIIMALGFCALLTSNITFLVFIIFLTGALAALFSPAKSGCIPELVDEPLLSKANGMLGLVTVAPAALGFLLGKVLFTTVQTTESSTVIAASLFPSMAVIMGISLLSLAISFGLETIVAADPGRQIPWNPIKDAAEAFGRLKADTPLLRTALGIAFFWILASLAQLNVDQLGEKDLARSEIEIGIMGMMLVIGVGLGSVLAGLWSGGHVELGIVPMGAIGMAFWSMMLCVGGWYGHTFPDFALVWICIGLFFLGLSAGLFDVPLESYLQHQSEPRHLGQIVAATNQLAFAGILGMSLIYYLMIDVWKISPSFVFLLAGIGTLPVAVYIILLLPSATVRFVFWLIVKIFYRVRAHGLEHIPRTGGALLTPNHISWVDGILLLITVPRPVRFIIYADFVNDPKLNWLARIFDVIPIKADGGPKTLIQSLRMATDALKNGELVCIFPEGALTRTGQTQPFQAGMLRILKGTDAPIIPVYLHGLWGSIFSYRGGTFFWKWPQKRRYPVSIHFDKPFYEPKTAGDLDEPFLVDQSHVARLVPAILN